MSGKYCGTFMGKSIYDSTKWYAGLSWWYFYSGFDKFFTREQFKKHIGKKLYDETVKFYNQQLEFALSD